MITLSLAAVFVLTVAGLLTLRRAASTAPEGYEDEAGFHFGPMPEIALLQKSAEISSRIHENCSEASANSLASVEAA